MAQRGRPRKLDNKDAHPTGLPTDDAPGFVDMPIEVNHTAVGPVLSQETGETVMADEKQTVAVETKPVELTPAQYKQRLIDGGIAWDVRHPVAKQKKAEVRRYDAMMAGGEE